MALYVLPYFVFRRLNLVLQQSANNRIKVANNAKHARNSGALHLSVGDEKHEHLCLLVVKAHGSSKAEAFKDAVLQAYECSSLDVSEKISEEIAALSGESV